jgi:hypothetical protein
MDLLRSWNREQAAERLKAPVWADLDLVFTDARGYPHNHDRVRRAFYKALKEADVRQVVLYALRHTMATITLHETKDLKLVATRLGHANEMLVLRTYRHLLPGMDPEPGPAVVGLGGSRRFAPQVLHGPAWSCLGTGGYEIGSNMAACLEVSRGGGARTRGGSPPRLADIW